MKNIPENKKNLPGELKLIDFKKNPSFLFFLGQSPQLAKKEVECLARVFLPFLWVPSMISGEVLMINTNKVARSGNKTELLITEDIINQYLSNFSKQLGGTVKVARILGLVDEKSIAGVIKKYFQEFPKRKLTFGLSFYPDDLNKSKIAERLAITIKKDLKKLGISSRFILPKDGSSLNSAQILHNQLTDSTNAEFNLNLIENQYLLSRTTFSQNIDEWSKKDLGIPAVDSISGMLPPKLARILVNLAESSAREIGINRNDIILYDPFCGNGRIVLEALELRLDIRASDVDPKKVSSTIANLSWLIDKLNLTTKKKDIREKVTYADARTVKITDQKKQLIICSEPDLGPALINYPDSNEVLAIQQRLSALYQESIENLINFSPVLILIFPAWRTKNGKVISLFKNYLDKFAPSRYHLEQLGEYSRPNSFIIREIIAISRKL